MKSKIHEFQDKYLAMSKDKVNEIQTRYDEKTAFEIWLEEQQDMGGYPDGFNPNLYDL